MRAMVLAMFLILMSGLVFAEEPRVPIQPQRPVITIDLVRSLFIKNPVLYPDVQLTALDGKKKKLSEFRGKVVILSVWATWCGPCQQEMRDLEKLYQQYHKDGLEILAVGIDDDLATVQKATTDRQVTFPVFWDPAGVTLGLRSDSALPMSQCIDRGGLFRFFTVGYDLTGDVAHVIELAVQELLASEDYTYRPSPEPVKK